MKPILILFGVFVCIIAWSCRPESHSAADTPDDALALTAYDSALARRLGADEYGMKHYVMAFLKAGPDRSQDSATAARLQQAHLDNITRMADAGKLALAGPFMDDGDLRGIYVFNVATLDEARALTESDPAIIAGRLIMELKPWYGPASLMMVPVWQKKLQRKKI